MIIRRYALINTRVRARKKTIQYRGRARAAVVEPQTLWLNYCYHDRRPVVTATGRTSSCAGETVTLSHTRHVWQPKSLLLRVAAINRGNGRRWFYIFIFFRDLRPYGFIVNGFFVCFQNIQQSRGRYCYWRRPCKTIPLTIDKDVIFKCPSMAIGNFGIIIL